VAFLERLNQFVSILLNVARQLIQWRIWLVLIVYYGFQLLILYVHYDYPSGPLSVLMTKWVSLFGEETVSAYGHYPQHFMLLGKISYWAKLGFGLVFEGVVLGSVAGLFYRRFAGPGSATDQLSLGTRWFNLTLVWTIVNGLMLAAGQLMPGLLAQYLTGPRRILAFSFVLMPFVFTLIFSIFFLAIPSVVIYRDDVFKALGRSFRHFRRRPMTLFGLGFVILAIPILLGAMASRPTGIVDSFKPELLYWILIASLLSEMIAGFFWMGSAVRFLVEEER